MTTASLHNTIIDDPTLKTLEDKGLTRRELEVLQWVIRGKTNGEIGLILHISARTVSKHLEHVFIKLGVSTRTSATVWMVEHLNGRAFY